ncbi:MAG: radical SAM/SPASM domain-containing protein [Acidobacteriota bacterium]
MTSHLDIGTAKVGIELTNRCNMRCTMCPLPNLSRPAADMPWDLVEKVAADFAANGIQVRWLHEMGEPLLYERLAEAIDLFPGCSVSTNAMALTPEIGEKLLGSTLGRLRLCPDTVNPEVYPEIRKGGVYDKVVANIKAFLDQAAGASMAIEIQKMVSKPTAAERIEDFENLYDIGRFANAKIIEKTCEGLDTTDATDLHEVYYGCFQGYPFKWFIVMADGRVTHCCYDSDCLQPIGDMKTQTVEEIVHGETIDRFMEAFQTRDWETLPRCGECHRNATPTAVMKDQLVQLGHRIERLVPVKAIGRRVFNRGPR